MSSQLVKGVSDGLGGCDFYSHCFRRNYRCYQPTHPEGSECWRERNNKPDQEEAVASS